MSQLLFGERREGDAAAAAAAAAETKREPLNTKLFIPWKTVYCTDPRWERRKMETKREEAEETQMEEVGEEEEEEKQKKKEQ